ncbi:autotransporter outer membrane beta-barrel domain-containing protein [Roseixanthobacter glucoisosaccharinicivorans]|uniref:autotransporter outer membrane beta-barrel domain-containing protein n=1 Tax=Roseixanthobacter glucoisosaccharinicivorans TaxID=3119923 RepID=UPI003727FF9E
MQFPDVRWRGLFASVRLTIAILVASTGFAAAQSWNMYDNYNTSYTVPYATDLSQALANAAAGRPGQSLTIAMSINGGPAFYPTLDTGSTGIAVGTQDFINKNQAIPTSNGTVGWVFYNSTDVLLTGYFTNATVSFSGSKVDGTTTQTGVAVTTDTMPILVVTHSQCLNPDSANGCPPGSVTTANPNSVTATPNCTTGVNCAGALMMGVGFDRNTMGAGTVDVSNTTEAIKVLNGKPTTSSIYNPFLNITGMNEGTVRRGYIITPTQVELGLTTANTSAAAFTYGQLALANPSAAGGPNNWQAVQAQVTIQVPGSNVVSGTGTLLMDTGVTDAFIEVPGAPDGVAPVNTTVGISFVGGSATYTITAGDTGNPQVPGVINLYNPASQFVNSSLHTYAGFDVLYDGDGGFIGIAPNNFSSQTNASVKQIIAAQGNLDLTQDFATDLPVLLMGASTVSSTGAATFNSPISGFTGSEVLTLASGTIYLNGSITHLGSVAVTGGTTVLNNAATGAVYSGALNIAKGAAFQSYTVVDTGGNATGGYSVGSGATLTNAGTFTATTVLSNTSVSSGGFSAIYLSGSSGAGQLSVPYGGVQITGTFGGVQITGVAGGAQISGGAGPVPQTFASVSPSSATPTGQQGLLVNDGTIINTGIINADIVNNGTFKNNGTLNGTVIVTGTQSGSGTVTNLLAQSGSTVSPGNSIGKILVANNAAFASGSTLLMELGANGTSDQILVGGAVISDGAQIHLKPGAGFVPQYGASYTLISAASISGSFVFAADSEIGTAGALYPFLGSGFSVSNGDLVATLGRSAVPFAALAQTPNQAATAFAADSLPVSSSLIPALAILTAGAAPAAFDALSGEVHATAQSVLQTQSTYVRDAISGRLRQATSGTIVGDAPTTATLGSLGATLWVQAYGGWGDNNGNANASGYSSSIGGFLIGLDTAWADWRVGLAAGFGQSTFDLDTVPSNGSSDTYDLALYAGRSFGASAMGAWAVRLGAAYSWHDISTSRSVVLPGFAQGYGAGYAGRTGQLFGELGYDFALPSLGKASVLEPFAGFSYVAQSTDGFTESLGAAMLSGRASDFDTLSTVLGLRGSSELRLGAAPPLTLSGTLGWQHAFGDLAPTTTMAFAGAPIPFTVTGAPLAEDALVVGAGLSAKLGEAVDLGIFYNGQLGSNITENAVKGNFTWRF